MKSQDNITIVVMMRFLIITASIIVSSLLIICYILGHTFRQILNIWLKITIPNYKRLLSTEELSWAAENVRGNISNLILLIKYDKPDKNIFDVAREKTSDILHQNREEYLKLMCTRHQYLGYQYLVNNNCDVNELVKKMDENVEDENALKTFVGKVANSPLPQNNTSLWEVIVGTKPVRWHENPEHTNLYPILFRIHHMVGDGWSIINFLLTAFADPQYRSEYFLKSILENARIVPKQDLSLRRKILNFMQTSADTLWVVFNIVEVHFRQTKYFTTKDDSIVFDAKNFTGKTITCFTTEENEELVPICKKSRRILGQNDTKFVHIVLASVARSLSTHFQKKVLKMPDEMIAYLTVLLKLPEKHEKAELLNNFTVEQLHFPTNPTISMTEAVKNLRTMNDFKKTLQDARWNYIGRQNMGVFPVQVSKYFLNLFEVPLVVTNLPLPPKFEVFDGCEVFEFLGFPTTWGNSGMTMCCTSYRNRFQITLLVDTSILSKQEEAQKIVDDVLENFRLLNKELKN